MKNLSIPLAIIIGAIIIGSFYYYTEYEKQLSIERQTQMKIDQENQAKLDKQAEEVRQQQAILNQRAEEQKLLSVEKDRQAKVRAKCAVHLDRNGNYLVSNETLNTNYNACLHANGL